MASFIGRRKTRKAGECSAREWELICFHSSAEHSFAFAQNSFSRLGYQAKLDDNLLCDFAGGAEVAVQEYVGLLVKLFTRREQGADFSERIGIVQQRTMGLFADALVNPFRRRPQADDQ